MAHSEFIENVEEGVLDEGRIQDYLLRHVLDATQKKFLFDRDLSVAGLMNGRYDSEHEQGVFDWMRSVNASLGYRLFTVV